MGRPRKPPRLSIVRPTIRGGSSQQSLVEAARTTIAKALASLDACVGRVATMLEGEDVYSDKAASHLAWLTKHVAQILGEVRKLEAHDRNTVGKMSPEERDRLVVEYLRDLQPERRGEFRVLLDQLDASEAILA